MTLLKWHLAGRIIVLTLLAFTLYATPAQAGYCDEVCYPTCDDWAGHCAADGGTVSDLCSCQTIGYGWNCSPGECAYRY